MTDTAALVLTSVATAGEGVALVTALLDRRLIACGTLLHGARSMYRWEGSIVDAAEVVVLLKTRAGQMPTLKAAVDELHPYAVPEFLAVPVQDVLARYLAWIDTETHSIDA